MNLDVVSEPTKKPKDHRRGETYSAFAEAILRIEKSYHVNDFIESRGPKGLDESPSRAS